MKNCDYILQNSERLKHICQTLRYKEDDIRRDLFGMIYDVLNNYYYGYITFELSQEVNNKNVAFHPNIKSAEVHINRFAEISLLPLLTISHLSSLNKQLLIGAWTSFELSITTLAETVLTENDKEKLKTKEYNDIVDILKKSSISETEINKLRKKLYNDHLTHLPLWRKFDALAQAAGPVYLRDRKKDIEFLQFYGKMRNCLVHSNSLYYGNNFDYKFDEFQFKFENGKGFTYTIDESNKTRVYILLAKELTQIYYKLIRKFESFDFISYPDTTEYWSEY